MRHSILMRRTILLVLCTLLLSTLFTTFAFTLAGKTTTLNLQTNESFSQIDSFANYLNTNPSLINDPNTVSTFFTNDLFTGRSFFLLDSDGNLAVGSATTSESSTENIDLALNYARENFLGRADPSNSYALLEIGDLLDRVLVIERTIIGEDGNAYYLISVSSVTESNQIVSEYVNILLLSTICAALTMLIPVYLVVRRIINPISKVNSIAMAYGKGDFSVRADETKKGEVGEIATSVNFLADQLSKSISDLTLERNRLQDVFDVISEGIVVINENMSPIFVNKTMSTLFSKVAKKNLFTEKLQLVPFDDVWQDFEQCILTATKMERTLEGPNYAYQITLIPKFSVEKENVCVGATGFFRDISEEQKLERTRKDYVANISHELRTPLQTLRGLIEPLADGMVKNEEDKMRYYSIILHETMRLSRLIDDMLELSKLQSRTLAFKTFPFDLNSLLTEIEAKYMSVMKNSELNFKVQFNTGKLPTVMGNPDRVEQVLVILMDNARKYTQAGGSITISSEYNEAVEKVFVSVIDTGQGIHEYDINHIFDRFFKADRARGKKGTGLGLAIAKELLTYMGEDITVESVYGEGTTFTFTLKKVAANTAWF